MTGNSLYKYFTENVYKNIIKSEEEKTINKLLLEKVMILCKKIKRIKSNKDNQ